MEHYDVDFYYKANGDCPVAEFLDSLDVKMRAKVLGSIALLEEMDLNFENPTPNLSETAFLKFAPSKATISRAFCTFSTLKITLF